MYRQNFDHAQPVETPRPLPAAPDLESLPRTGWWPARLSRPVQRLLRRRRFIRQYWSLADLPDHRLRDVGLHRGQINRRHLASLLKDPANWDV